MKLRPLINKKGLIQNKKGNVMLIIVFFLVLFVIMFIGFIMIVGSSVVNWVWDEVMPEIEGVGSVDQTNVTEISKYTLTPVNTVIQNFTWLTGVLYVLMLVASLGIVFIARATPSKWLIGFYLMLALVLIIACMFISNIYEEFSIGNDDLAIRLREHTILHHMLLYSPAIFTIIIFATGIILFSGIQTEELV